MKTIIDNFVDRVIEYGMYNEIDKIYVKNRVLALIGEEGTDRISDENDLKQIKDYLVEIALKNGKIKDLIEEKECLGAELMNFIVPLPSRLNDIFWSSYDISPQEAVEEFYKLSKDSDYIKTSAIAKNIEFRSSTKYGELEITINLSKPEKDPKTIATEKLVKATNYPKCLLCMENEGYQGRINYPARSNHRIIRLKLGDEVWGFQYSPYSYFNEHAIFLNSQHVKHLNNYWRLLIFCQDILLVQILIFLSQEAPFLVITTTREGNIFSQWKKQNLRVNFVLKTLRMLMLVL